MMRQLRAQLYGSRLPVTHTQQPASPADPKAAAAVQHDTCKCPGNISGRTAGLKLWRSSDSATISVSASVCSRQDQLVPYNRRSLLLAVGLSPVLGAGVLSAAHAEGLDSSSTQSEAADAGPGSDGSVAQQQGSSIRADDSGPAAEQSRDVEPDDSPRQILDEDEDDSDSSSSSSSSSDSESDSSSSDDDEPGELYASNDNNAAGGGHSNGDNSGDNSSSNNSGGNDGGSSISDATAADSSTSTSRGANDASSITNSSSSNGSNTTSSSSSSTTTSSSSSTVSKRTAMSANLSVPSYVQILQDSRRSSWPLLAQKIQAGEWIELSQLLVQPPFDAVRQACFYIPWALLQSDDFVAAVAARRAYVDYIDHVHALAAIALKAADGVPGADVQVQQAFTLMNASLNAFLSAVPVKYQRNRI